MSESNYTQDSAPRLGIDIDDPFADLLTRNTVAQMTTQESDTPTPTKQTFDASDVQVRLRGPQNWNDTRSPSTLFRVVPYANDRVASALTSRAEGSAAAHVMQEMKKYADSQKGDLVWPQSEQDKMKDEELHPTDTETYKVYTAKVVPELESMAEEYNLTRQDGEVGIKILPDEASYRQASQEGYTLVKLRDTLKNANHLKQYEEDMEQEREEEEEEQLKMAAKREKFRMAAEQNSA